MNKNQILSKLSSELGLSEKLDQIEIAAQIQKIGYQCQECGECCREKYGDNTVALFPSEIKKIMEEIGVDRLDIATIPPTENRIGNHAIWILLRKDGDCKFLDKNKCRIYDSRPWICKTYPFYLKNKILEISECRGVGRPISKENSVKLAGLLKERYLDELKETIRLIGKS